MENTDEVAFQPNEDLLKSLMALGISKPVAEEALFCTGNDSLDEAANYVFTNIPEASSSEPRPDIEGANVGDAETRQTDSFKMVFVINSSLDMGVGKVAAQVAHACLGLFRDMRANESNVSILNTWEQEGEKKVVLQGRDRQQLEDLFRLARSSSLPCYLVRDAGRTQIPANSVTVLSIFGQEEDVNRITGSLSLL